jgi:signal transduction histidine kinase
VISQVALSDPGATVESLSTAHQRVLAAGAEQEQLIDALLTLARGQAGLDQREPFDLAAVSSQVIAARQPEASRRNITLHVALAPAPTSGSPGLAERLTANLIDNALRYNLPGGRVLVTTGSRGSRAVLSVVNTGPAIPASAVDRLFRPFQRLAPDRASSGEGLGLGLSIVQAIADAHGASITARPRPAGGLLVEATFPGPGPHAVHPARETSEPAQPGRAGIDALVDAETRSAAGKALG